MGTAAAQPESGWARVRVGVVAGTAVLGLVLGTLLGWVVFGGSTPGDDSVAAGFTRDMAEHHAQAVEMSLEVLQTTEDDGVRALATDIASTQGNQLGQMEGWIRQWGLPMARPGDRMEWMDGHHSGHTMHLVEGAPMAGMASPEQMESLRAAEGEAADILYLQLMTTHHIAGVEMAQAALDGGVEGEVRRLAAAMVNGQEAEIDLMHGMLEELGAPTQEASGTTVGVAGSGSADTGDHADHSGDGAEETGGHDH
ncbi:DUF305 domain-containing protein [Ornithinimicrobium cavernae]|uniref:DUF305 domain-containing protein n=1 Tax=Ornithinimicrobium cavernae TaxID=2666047 RepID=UPI00192A1A35|nr:DUF305 domain-containing protein [Ornithinimicrobium cavernae]